ncbi:MAG: nucleotidyltransferase domain-containing protein [Bacteroides sp.]|nr:nucleotidyltransferase domain-containing protein [Bacteroides sp.]MCM1379592.1 nucleotidyltransferase domain-containing protein [Bacteroides sp.]MCM1446026.1 nucleotidyltransferase domain-containing protein [Prevotella sp.]
MDKEQAIKLARRYKSLLEEYLPVKALYLYGSFSKDTYTKDSDIDIAVVVDSLDSDYFADTPILWKIKRRISNLIEPVLLTEDKNNPLFSDILRTGILI